VMQPPLTLIVPLIIPAVTFETPSETVRLATVPPL